MSLGMTKSCARPRGEPFYSFAAKRLPEAKDAELLLAWQRKTIRVASQR